ncbi:MAG: HlyD family efflux transporter periplasmic adaptor subunit [Planctomycetes bacterium]|nr:HlyD family efflux transporter periplasmic adaptor subunit [Planctomycetota bacterium]
MSNCSIRWSTFASAVLLCGAVSCDALGGGPDETIEGAEVRKGSLAITVVERGNLKASDVVSLKSEIEGSSTILYLIPEGTHVEAGTLLCELDATSLVDKRVSQEISVRNAEAAMVEARQNLEIQKSQNESDIANAEQTLEFAHQDLKKYRDGDMLVKEQAAREEITLKTEESARAQEQFEWSQKLAEKGFLTNTELEADRLAEKRSQILLEQAERELKLLIDYEFPREIQKLEAALREAERELDRVKLQAEARLVDRTSALETNEAKLKLEQEKLSKLVRQIEKAKLIAPKAGMVVYAKQEEGGRFGNSQPIAEGTSVRERQEVVTIPTAGGMIAQASLHESVLKQVEVGMAVDVRIDALPGQIFKGKVKTVAVLPDQNSWWANPNLRLYRCDVEVSGATSEMRPGMSCSIEIFCDELADATYVPVTAVFRHKGESVCFVAQGTKYEVRTIETGRFNDKWVEIVRGVTAGERVLLSVPSDFKIEAPENKEGEEGASAEAAAGLGMPGASSGAPAAATERGAPGADAGGPGAPSTDGAPRRGGPRRGGADGDASGGGERPQWNGERPSGGERPAGDRPPGSGRRGRRSGEGSGESSGGEEGAPKDGGGN